MFMLMPCKLHALLVVNLSTERLERLAIPPSPSELLDEDIDDIIVGETQLKQHIIISNDH